MLKLKKIAITGGVASGKSSVCRFFEELGAFVVNADAIVHKLLDPNTNLGQKIIRQFGTDVLEEDDFHDRGNAKGNIKFNRRMLAEIVFKDPAKLKQLEELLHPAVLQNIEDLYRQTDAKKFTSFVVEIPLLYEIGAEAFYDVIIAVLSNEDAAKVRFEKAGYQPKEYDQRMSRQLKPSHKAAKAHYTLHNNGSLENLKQEVFELNRIIQNT